MKKVAFDGNWRFFELNGETENFFIRFHLNAFRFGNRAWKWKQIWRGNRWEDTDEDFIG